MLWLWGQRFPKSGPGVSGQKRLMNPGLTNLDLQDASSFSDQIQIRMCIFARVHVHANRIQRWLDPFSIPSRKVKILLGVCSC